MDTYQALIIATASGVISSVATITAIKVDISWIKKEQRELRCKVNTLEDKVAGYGREI
ncbi:hypothetical protein [Vibrio lentus]|uniref:hypothetical protein n=1 Tax=Vibrio lentus TaxID=136468 RepID=UPI0014831F4C|nr:hypothetical protein [Vibrio lentus]